jgi:hypothetical protein
MKDISIGIVTFSERRDLIKKLITQIKDRVPDDIDIVLAINGNHDELMEDNYRQEMLELCSKYNNIYPIFCPEFKSLPKLWNTLVIFSRTKYCFILSDDVGFENPNPIQKIDDYIKTTGCQFFTINGGFESFVVSKNMLHTVGYFDERLIGFGWEDMDIIYRYRERFLRPIPKLDIPGVYNMCAFHLNNKKIETSIANKPRFNDELSRVKYESAIEGGLCVMSPNPIVKVMNDIPQYPYEMFVLKNKHNLSRFEKILYSDTTMKRIDDEK